MTRDTPYFLILVCEGCVQSNMVMKKREMLFQERKDYEPWNVEVRHIALSI